MGFAIARSGRLVIPFFTADALVAHAVGDYLLQSHWMATEKTKRSLACLAHVVLYALPFLFLTRDPRALAFIAGTHFVVDRWRLARYVVWAKNFLAPRHLEYEGGTLRNHPWRECEATGYGPDAPAFLAVWLLIIADNLIHIGLNGCALYWWGS